MKRIFLILCAVLAIAGCDREKSDKPVVKIGVMLPMSGENAEFGKNSLYAIEFAADDHKDSPIKFKIIFEDDMFSPSKATIIANKFINVDKVDAMVSSFSPVGSVVSPIANKARVLHISLANAANIVEGNLNFTDWQLVDVAAQKMVDYLVSQKCEKVVSFNMQTVGNEEFRVKTNEFLDKNNIKYKEFSFTPDNHDCALMIQKAKTFGADYWILNSFSPALEIIRKDMLANDLNIPVINIQNMSLTKNPELFENQVFIGAPDGDANFVSRMAKKTKSKVLTIPAYAYDIVNLIMIANEDFYAKNGRTPNGYELVETLKETKFYNGIVGKLEVQDNGVIKSPSVVKKFVNGEQVIIGE